jgi:phosphopantothenoylcysteine decarboxylase/phosphopantothenate--cysteine ligase
MDESSRIAILEGRRILLGVSGSIAAYKAVDLASKLTQAGAEVDVLLSPAGREFVTPLTFQSLTGRKAYTEHDLWGDEAHVLHVGLAEAADLLAIAPATANTIAKIATGQADSLISLAALAARCPILIAPAMDVGMYENPATQENIETLKARGVHFAGPAEGRMASGLSGRGRFLEPDEIMGHIRKVLGLNGPLAGKKVVVTAGGTQEPLDPVRMLANRSSGKQGYALAQASVDRGAEVVLVSGPTALETPIGVRRVNIETAEQVKEATLEAVAGASALLMAAAVADYRPAHSEDQKIKRREGVPELTLEPTEDVLGAVIDYKRAHGEPDVVVGFAAESRDLIANAQKKLREKSLDLIVANDITAKDAGFSVDTNRVTLIDADGHVEELPLLSKVEVAERVLERVLGLLRQA